MQFDIASALNIPEQLLEDFKQHRKNKKAPITKTVIDGFHREAKKAGITIEEAIRTCIERNWVFFKADWIKEKEVTQRTTFHETLKGYLDDSYNNIIIDIEPI